MSIEPPPRKEETSQIVLHRLPSSLGSGPTTQDEKFCFQISENVGGQGAEDKSLYWSYEMSNQVSGEFLRKLVFREQQYYVRSTDSAAISQTIYIQCDEVPGFKNGFGVTTNNVCALHLTAIQSLYDDSGEKNYDLLYKQTQDFAWDIPSSLGSLRFRIVCDGDLREGELPFPMICQFDIRHIGR